MTSWFLWQDPCNIDLKTIPFPQSPGHWFWKCSSMNVFFKNLSLGKNWQKYTDWRNIDALWSLCGPLFQEDFGLFSLLFKNETQSGITGLLFFDYLVHFFMGDLRLQFILLNLGDPPYLLIDCAYVGNWSLLYASYIMCFRKLITLIHFVIFKSLLPYMRNFI